MNYQSANSISSLANETRQSYSLLFPALEEEEEEASLMMILLLLTPPFVSTIPFLGGEISISW